MSDDDTVFTIHIEADVYLSIEDVWPDGDAPENPTAEDVRAVMESCGYKLRVLRDWDLLEGVNVTVEDDNTSVRVWR